MVSEFEYSDDIAYDQMRNLTLEVIGKRDQISTNELPPMGRVVPYFNNKELSSKVVKNLYCQKYQTENVDPSHSAHKFSDKNKSLFNEVLWDLFRQGIITIYDIQGTSSSSSILFTLTKAGESIISRSLPYYFYSTDSYESTIKREIPAIDPVTLIYLREAMNSYFNNCVLSSTVMLGVAAEYSFDLLLEDAAQSLNYANSFQRISGLGSINQRISEFKKEISVIITALPPNVRDNLGTNIDGILAIIKTFRNDSGHPSGLFISSDQLYINLNLYVYYCKKIYELRGFFQTN